MIAATAVADSNLPADLVTSADVGEVSPVQAGFSKLKRHPQPEDFYKICRC